MTPVNRTVIQQKQEAGYLRASKDLRIKTQGTKNQLPAVPYKLKGTDSCSSLFSWEVFGFQDAQGSPAMPLARQRLHPLRRNPPAKP
jgi:hypothetical protein